MKMRRRIRVISTIFFVIYMFVLVYFLLLSDGLGRDMVYETYRVNLIPFQEIKRFVIYRNYIDEPLLVLINLLGNVIAFVPFGALIRWVVNRRVRWFQAVGYTCMFSVCVECLQLVAKVGVFDVDDILLNTIGGLIGFWLYYILLLMNRRREQQNERKCL